MEKENDSKWEYELNVLIDQATNHKGREKECEILNKGN